MEAPDMRLDPATGEVVEYQPVKVDRKVLQSELAEAQTSADTTDTVVNELERQHAEAVNRVTELEETLKPAYQEQEAAHELLIFRQTKCDLYDAVKPTDPSAVDETPSGVGEAVDGGGSEGTEPTQDVADSDGSDEAATDESDATAPSEEVEVPVRRRAAA